MSSPLSFQGLSTGLQTDSLVNAILQQEGQPVQRMQAQQSKNTQRITALQTLSSNLTSLSSSLATLTGTSFGQQTVTSSDTTNAYVTGTASGAAVGNYSINVGQIATAGRISPTLSGGAPTNMAVADPLNTAVFTGTSASFAVRGTDGVIKTLSLNSSNNNLYGLRDAINASGAGVQATVINTGTGANPYQLVVTSTSTGTGTTSGVVTLADITSGGAVNTLGIGAGTVDSTTAPTTLTGGLQSGATDVAKDAIFSVNGIQLTRKTNVVSDAVAGVTFTLKQGGQAGTTNLSVATDTNAITTAMQDVVSKFNTMVSTFNTAAAPNGALYGDSVARSLVTQIRTALSGVPSGLPLTSTYTSAGGVGLKVNQDGTLSLDTTAFQAALAKDPSAVKKVFAFTGASDSAAVQFYAAGAKTTTGSVGFNITSYASGGAVSGTFTVGGSSYSLSGTSGVLTGTAGTPLEGLILNVSGTGTGNLTLSRGVGQSVQDLVAGMTAAVSGQLPQIIQNVNDANSRLAQQIASGQDRLARRKVALQAQFAQMEAIVGQLQSAGSSLQNLG
ncbi:MAG TPA: flagellar filament capping protein FliD [Holophagaceae bacterium]